MRRNKYYELALWNYRSMNFSDERARELAEQAMKIWFRSKQDETNS
jgi:hypothetical protein